MININSEFNFLMKCKNKYKNIKKENNKKKQKREKKN
jgi:hypothetical protein